MELSQPLPRRLSSGANPYIFSLVAVVSLDTRTTETLRRPNCFGTEGAYCRDVDGSTIPGRVAIQELIIRVRWAWLALYFSSLAELASLL